jgi:hypothetical protein
MPSASGRSFVADRLVVGRMFRQEMAVRRNGHVARHKRCGDGVWSGSKRTAQAMDRMPFGLEYIKVSPATERRIEGEAWR